MLNYIDFKYINLVGQQLRNFKKKKDTLFNCSCPICGDSSKKKTKARGYFYAYNNSTYYKCHNCHASMSFSFFLKTYYTALHNSYAIEKFSDNASPQTAAKSMNKPKIAPIVTSVLDIKPKGLSNTKCKLDSLATKICDLSDEHPAKAYVMSRQISERFYELMYFTEDFANLVTQVFDNIESKLYHDSRLIIPFYNSQKELIGIQGRALQKDSELRYITIKPDSQSGLLYGMERFNPSEQGYVVEGPIDSTFIPNCLATANSNLELACDMVRDDLTLIFDNEPRNKEIVSLVKKSINHNRRVCIWPQNIVQKDINDMVMSGIDPETLMNIIQNRTFTGLKAMLEFNQWKRV